jgi:inhibitor of cysteine peptidase
MKKILAVILAMIAVLSIVGFSGCSTRVQAHTDSGEVINAKVNQEFTIALGANKTTGYSWQAKFDANYVTQLKEDYKQDDTTGKVIVGAGGTQYFSFKAVKTGQTGITFTYYRPWETPTAQDKVENFTINVK